MEPGRFLVGNAGVLLTRVLYRKHSGGKDYVVTDAGMTELLRPSHYGAYHRIEAVRRARSSARVDVVGPVCESGDFLALDRELDDVQPGDSAGRATAAPMASRWRRTTTPRPRAAEVLVDGDRFAVDHRARDVRRSRAARDATRPRLEDRLMRVGLIADTHDRLPAIAELVRADAGGGRRHGAARRRLLLAVLAQAVRGRTASRSPASSAATTAITRDCAARAAAAFGIELFESPHSFEVGGQRILLVHDIGDVHQRSVDRRTTIVIHGFTHQQEMKTRGDTLIVNPGRRCGWLYGTPSAAILDLDSRARGVHQACRTGVDVTRPTTSRILILDYGSQFTQLIARRVREARVYSRDPSAHAHASSGSASGSRRASS